MIHAAIWVCKNVDHDVLLWIADVVVTVVTVGILVGAAMMPSPWIPAPPVPPEPPRRP